MTCCPRPLLALLLLLSGPAAADDPFRLIEIPSDGRTVTAELADLDGDGRTDLLQVVFEGIPPDDRREIRAYLQRPDGSLPSQPNVRRPLPGESAAYQVADLLPDPGTELLLLRPGGVSVLSFARPHAPLRELSVADGPTLGAAEDERGLKKLGMLTRDLADQPWLMVPQFGVTLLLDPQGQLRARLQVGARANYFVAPSDAPLVLDSDIQLFFDAPRMGVGDVDGDGRSDVVASGRHEVRVFLRRPDGSFGSAPDRLIPLRRVSEPDHIRGQGTVRVEARDIDADGRLDLVVAHSSGGLTRAQSETRVYLNRGDGWAMDSPDNVFTHADACSAHQLVDLTGDGKLELVRVRISFGVLELVEMLLQRAVDADVVVHRVSPHGFEPKPWASRKLAIPYSLETSRSLGFLPTIAADLNGDGFRDLLTSGKGRHIDVFLGAEKASYRRRAARQKLTTSGRLRTGDFDGDGLVDLLLFDTRNPELPIRIVVNRGVLPGTPPLAARVQGR